MTTKRQQVFDFLKGKLTSTPILAMSLDQGQYILDVDSSTYAVGVVLQQVQDGFA